MMYQMTSAYQRELNHIQQYHQVPNGVQPSIQMSPYMQPVPQQVSPVSCFTLDPRPFSTAQLPITSSMSLNDYQSHTSTPLSQSPQLRGWNLNQAIVPPLTLNDDMVYNCNFLGQLQGNYEIQTPAGQDQVSVSVPTVSDNEKQYAIVRRVCCDGEALPDQFIYQEPNSFTLCSVNGNVDAELRRGCNMKHTVKWQNSHDGRQLVWRRKGEVTFNLVSADSLASSRRNSISSVASASTGLSSCMNSPSIVPNGMPMQIRPELLQHSASLQQSRPTLMSTPSYCSYASNESFQPDLNNQQEATADVETDNQEQAMFELIKAHCVGNSSLLKRMVHWALRNRSMRQVTSEDLNNLSEGRLWVTAHEADFLEGAEIDERLQESLENIKGAYMEVRTGVYKQPEPQVNEPGIQHRLIKGSLGYWKIEGHNVDSGKWEICAKELSNGRWADMKNNGRVIGVQLIPMSDILRRLEDEFSSENQEVEKNMEFLFTSCNQKKLNSKLKGRNLKHNISNLKVKLEKQYALRFAVQVATTADSIAQKLDVSR